MASYNEDQISSVNDIIEALDLEIYACKRVIDIADEAMDDGDDAQDVADAVVDYLWENNLGNVTMAAGNNLMVDKQTLLDLRQDIMQALA